MTKKMLEMTVAGIDEEMGVEDTVKNSVGCQLRKFVNKTVEIISSIVDEEICGEYFGRKPMIKLVEKMKVVETVNHRWWTLLSWCLSWAEKSEFKGGGPTRRKRGYPGIYYCGRVVSINYYTNKII